MCALSDNDLKDKIGLCRAWRPRSMCRLVNSLGVKGVGEAGTIGSTACVYNGVFDALKLVGVKTLDMPLKPETAPRK